MFTRLDIADVVVFEPKRFGDHRGYFSETYNKRQFLEFGLAVEFVQDNQSLSRDRGVLRGLHFQARPFAQDKLVRCVAGAVFDVAVDIRHGSPTFGRSVSATLSAENGRQIFVPKGFAHGFVTLTPNTEVVYKVTDYYAPEHDFGLAWNDPAIGINWPIPDAEIILSEKDRKHPSLRDAPKYFEV
ncbi:MAG: dTDP-4-dehydrorhamnose 3,5-epimerase [Maricaulaceae bacterium]